MFYSHSEWMWYDGGGSAMRIWRFKGMGRIYFVFMATIA